MSLLTYEVFKLLQQSYPRSPVCGRKQFHNTWHYLLLVIWLVQQPTQL
jgi:hypothetical protein